MSQAESYGLRVGCLVDIHFIVATGIDILSRTHLQRLELHLTGHVVDSHIVIFVYLRYRPCGVSLHNEIILAFRDIHHTAGSLADDVLASINAYLARYHTNLNVVVVPCFVLREIDDIAQRAVSGKLSIIGDAVAYRDILTSQNSHWCIELSNGQVNGAFLNGINLNDFAFADIVLLIRLEDSVQRINVCVNQIGATDILR